jgi:hypothetical protein
MSWLKPRLTKLRNAVFRFSVLSVSSVVKGFAVSADKEKAFNTEDAEDAEEIENTEKYRTNH